MRILTAAALAATALGGAAPASGAASEAPHTPAGATASGVSRTLAASTVFGAPRTLADWGPGGEFLAAAPGAAAWTHPAGVRLARAGGEPVRISGEGQVQDLAVAAGPVAGWVESDQRLHAYVDRDQVVTGTMERVRKVSATPSALGWIGDAGAERKLQIATRRPGGAFSAASTPAQAGRPAFGLDAAGSGSRSLFAWAAQDGGARRIQLLEVGADGRVSAARWLTAGDHDATSAAVAMGSDGAAVVAWVDGMPLGRVTAAAIGPDGAPGESQALDAEAGGAPEVAVGPDGAAVVVWPAGGRLKAALRAPGAAAFSTPVALPGENVGGWTASVTDHGETVVAWLDSEPGADPRQGSRLSAAVAPPGAPLGAPELLAEHAMTVAGAAYDLTWVDGRPDGAYGLERRVRTARLLRNANGGGAPTGPSADRRAPRVRVQVLGVRGHRLRIRLRTDERATVRISLRRGSRRAAKARATLRPQRATVLRLRVPAGARRFSLTVRATDGAGNTRTVRRALKLPR